MAAEDEAPETSATADALPPVRPESDKLVRAVARSRVAEKLFAAKEPVRLGRYHLLEMVGAGGMGVVWGAWDPELERRVAIKLLAATRSSARERILAEGQALAKLSHPNVVPVYDVGVVDDQVYLVMEWVRGKNLRAWCAEGQPPREVVAIYRAAGTGLMAAHDAGLVHRDFKPDNAIVGDDGRVRVLDFGLARGEVTAATVDGDDVTRGAGTPRYMAPEQVAGRELTAAADQFAFGISLREAIGGKSGEVPRWLDTILARATATAPADRFPSMAELVAALGRDPRTLWRRRALIAAAVGLAGGAFAAGTMRSSAGVEVCGGGEADVARVWNPTLREQLAAHLRGLGPYGASVAAQIGGELDAYATRWVGAHRSACMASEAGELPRPRYEENIGCLARARASLAAADEVLTRTELAHLPDALVAARSLPDPERCRLEAESSTIAPPSVMLAPRVAELANEVARARVLALALDARAIDVAEAAATAAGKLGYPPLVGRALLAHGVALILQWNHVGAIEVFERAHAAAFAAGDGAAGVEALARELFAIATAVKTLPVYAETTVASAKLAESVARGLGPMGAFARALLLNNLGTLRMSRGDPAGARVWFEAALRERPPISGETYELASIPGNLGLVESDPKRREALFAQEREELAAVVGEDHPLTLDARAKGAAFATDPDRARSELRETCLRVQRLHPHLVERFSLFAYDLAWLAFDAGDTAQAREASGWVMLDGEIEPQLVRVLRLLLDNDPTTATEARALADALVAKDALWRRWRSLDALIVAAVAEQRLGHRREALALVDRAFTTTTKVTSFANTMLYQRRLAKLTALRAALQ